MIPFNLEKALAGEPVKMIGAGTKKWVVSKSACFDDFYIVEDEDSAYRLPIDRLKNGFEMWEEPRPQVTITIPAPLKEAPELKSTYYALNSINGVTKEFWFDHWSDKKKLQSGLVFLTREDAESFAEALQEARR